MMNATEVLIEAMSEFGKGDEPCAAIVIFARPNGNVSLIGNGGGIAGLGMLEIAKTILAHEIMQAD